MTGSSLPSDPQAALAAAGLDLLQSLHVGVWMVDRDGVTTYLNRRMSELLGTAAERLIGGLLLDHVHPEDHVLVLEHIRRRRQGTSDAYDVRIVRRDGSLLPVRIQGSPVLHDGEYAGSIAAVTDLSDLSEAARLRDAALRTAQDANLTTTRFLTWMSHELRTPLNTIAGFAQLLEAVITDPAQLDMTRSIRTASGHVISLVQDMLDYSKADADVLEPTLTPVSIATVVDEALRLVGGTARDLSVTIDVQVGDEHVLADRRHLVQVLVNLLSNAVKYGGPGRTVHVRSVADGACVRCSVTDEGPGIPAAQHELAFRPFERLENAAGVSGAGLGLAIAESFMRAMHGTLSLASPPGGGATFTLELPATEAVGTTDDALGRGLEQAARLVLYVEDEPLNASLVKSIIGLLPGRSLHVEATVAGGVAAALALHPALVLLDLNLPDGTGFDVLAAIRAEPSLVDVPVFILSGDATEQATGRALALGADRFITKPFNLKEFVGLLEAAT